MNFATIPKTAVSSVVKNGKTIAPFIVGGLAALVIWDVFKAVKN